MKKTLTLIVMLFSFQNFSFSQDQHIIDSLQTFLKTAKQDTNRANILYQLSKAYRDRTPDMAMDYARQALALSEQISYKKGMGNAYHSMGVINFFNGDYLQALEHYKKALKIREELGSRKDIAACFSNMGGVYHRQGNYPEALKNLFAGLKIFEEIGDKRGIAGNCTNIGIIYSDQDNYPEALKYYFAGLKMKEEIGDKNGIALSYNNIGIIYKHQGNYPEALKSYFASLKIFEELGDKRGLPMSYSNIGQIYYCQGNYPDALKNHFAALKIYEDLGDKDGTALSYNNIGNTYTKQKKYDDASQYLNKSLLLSKKIGSLNRIGLCYCNLATLDSAQGKFEQSLEHYKMYIVTRDSIFNTEKTKKIMQIEVDKKEELAKAEQEKKDELAQKDLQKQKILRDVFLGGFAIVLLFAIVVFSQRNKIKKGKKRSEELLLNILPYEVAEELKSTGSAKAKTFSMVTVMFTDFKDFTKVSEKVSAELLVDEIHHCFSSFDAILQKYKIEKIKTIGDSYMCASGLPALNYTHATDMVNAAFEIRDFMLARKKEKEDRGEIPFELRIGIHTGPVVAGIVGVKKFQYDIWGDTVNLAARMESSGEAGKVNISGTTYELVKDKFKCNHRGKIQAKNKGEIDMYFVESGQL